MIYSIHTDGGSRGNPGQAACGVVIEEGDKQIGFGKTLGITTNNVAEYSGVISALEYINSKMKQNSKEGIYNFFLDSTLVVNQLNGLFKIKDAKLRVLLTKVRILEQEVGGKITYQYVPREQNVLADFQVNKALDALL